MPRTPLLITSLAVAGGLCAGVASHVQQVGAGDLDSRSMTAPSLPDRLPFAGPLGSEALPVGQLVSGLALENTVPLTPLTTSTSSAPSTTIAPPATNQVSAAPTTAPPDTAPANPEPQAEPQPQTQSQPQAQPQPEAAPEPSPPVAPAPVVEAAPAVDGTFDASAAASFLALTNQARAEVGVAPLQLDASLSAYARNHAMAMAAAGHIYHSQISSLLGPWSLVGENVGVGPTVNAIQNALLASPSHYQNLSDGAFSSMGIAVFIDSAGRMYTVHVFGN